MSILTEDGDFSFEYRSPEEIKKENELRRISELNHARITLNYRYKVSEVDDSLLIIIDEAIRIGVKCDDKKSKYYAAGEHLRRFASAASARPDAEAIARYVADQLGADSILASESETAASRAAVFAAWKGLPPPPPPSINNGIRHIGRFPRR